MVDLDGRLGEERVAPQRPLGERHRADIAVHVDRRIRRREGAERGLRRCREEAGRSRSAMCFGDRFASTRVNELNQYERLQLVFADGSARHSCDSDTAPPAAGTACP